MPIPNLLNHPSQICKPIPLLRINALRKTRNEFDGPGERLRKWFLTLPLAATSAHKLCQHRPGWRQPASLSSPVLALGLPALSLLQSPTLLTWSLKVSSNSGCHPFNQKKTPTLASVLGLGNSLEHKTEFYCQTGSFPCTVCYPTLLVLAAPLSTS